MNPMSTKYLPQGERDILRATNRQSLFALSEIRPDEFTRGRRPQPHPLAVVSTRGNSKPLTRINQTRKAA